MKIKQIDNEQNLQFQWDKMQYENMNAQAIHDWVMENKEVEIHLEDARACAATEAMKAKQVEAEVLGLSLMIKGIMPDADVAHWTFSNIYIYILLLCFCFHVPVPM